MRIRCAWHYEFGPPEYEWVGEYDPQTGVARGRGDDSVADEVARIARDGTTIRMTSAAFIGVQVGKVRHETADEIAVVFPADPTQM